MKRLMFNFENADKALIYFEALEAAEQLVGRKLTEIEYAEVVKFLVEEGVIQSVIETERTTEQILKDRAKHGSILHIKPDGTQEVIQ